MLGPRPRHWVHRALGRGDEARSGSSRPEAPHRGCCILLAHPWCDGACLLILSWPSAAYPFLTVQGLWDTFLPGPVAWGCSGGRATTVLLSAWSGPCSVDRPRHKLAGEDHSGYSKEGTVKPREVTRGSRLQPPGVSRPWRAPLQCVSHPHPSRNRAQPWSQAHKM